MGKITGFLEFQRIRQASEAPETRLHHWREFVTLLSDAQAQRQGARCMDCGIPFCSHACPVHNVIPDWNDLVYQQDWQAALHALHATNNFPEFTGRVCPAPCEAACTLNLNDESVGIKSIEQAIIEKGWAEGWVKPQPAIERSGRHVAIVGSGPAGLACAQQLARAGHEVTLFDRQPRLGGLLRYGIPDFKLDKSLIDRRLTQLAAEGVHFSPGTHIGCLAPHDGTAWRTPESLLAEFDAIVLAGGAEQPRDLPIPGRELDGVHYAMDFLRQQNQLLNGDRAGPPVISAAGKHVIVIGGGDTGSDCVGTSNRLGAASVTQLELLPQPPVQEDKLLTWPYWPAKLRTSSSHEEGCARDWSVTSQAFEGTDGHVRQLRAERIEWYRDDITRQMKTRPVEGGELTLRADLVLLAMGFVSPLRQVLDDFGVEADTRGNVKADTSSYRSSVDRVFTAGDMRRGQSLVVWAIREGRQCARAVDASLMGDSRLPG